MPERLLDVRALDAHYGDFQALFGVSMGVAEGEVVAVIGANGAGKSTLLKCIAGAMPARRDAIVFDGEPIGDLPAHEVVARGIALVPEGRRLFPSLTVEENLLIGGQLGRPGRGPSSASTSCSRCWRSAAHQPSHVAVRRPAADGRHRPRADVEPAASALRRDQPRARADRHPRHLCAAAAIVAEGISLVIVEQDIVQALKVASHVYCLQEGRVALAGEARTMTREKISAAYFGV